jgi:hypothetical protein
MYVYFLVVSSTSHYSTLIWTLEKQVEEYTEVAARKSELERTELQKEKTGVFSGSYAKNPATGEIIPIWVADYVLARFANLSLFFVSFDVVLCISIIIIVFLVVLNIFAAMAPGLSWQCLHMILVTTNLP